MDLTLFTQPKYTIDTSALLALMNSGEKYEKDTFKKLWEDVCISCDEGKIVSHIEVLKEIRDGGVQAQILWAREHKAIFLDYDLPAEGKIIYDIGQLGIDSIRFLEQGKQKSTHADPWLVAQAKINGLVLITEESSKKSSIPTICKSIGVTSLDLLGLIKAEGWSY